MTKTPQKPRLLVTGSTGRLGNLLRAAWASSSGAPVMPIYAARHAPADVLLTAGSLPTDLPPCDTVLALWGQTSGNAKQLAQNAELAHRSRALARACGAQLVLHLSSAAVYGPGTDMDETMPPAPAAHNLYGQSKLDMERAVATFAPDHARHCCLRLANVVGADSLAPALIKDAPVPLDRFEDGAGPLRSYLSPGDLARVLTALSLLPPETLPPVLNVASPDPVGMQDLAQAAGREIKWKTPHVDAIQTVTLNTDRLQALLPGLSLLRSAEQMISDWQSLKDAS